MYIGSFYLGGGWSPLCGRIEEKPGEEREIPRLVFALGIRLIDFALKR